MQLFCCLIKASYSVPSTTFTLMFHLGDVNKWALQYPYEQDDLKAFAAGARILAGA